MTTQQSPPTDPSAPRPDADQSGAAPLPDSTAAGCRPCGQAAPWGTGDAIAGLDRSDPAGHARRIRSMFDLVAARYDLMNDLMSGGTHRLWKHRLARLAGPAPTGIAPAPPTAGSAGGGRAASARGLALDLAGGTGDIAALLARQGWRVVLADPSTGMMTEGRRRRADAGLDHHLSWAAATAEALPFPDHSFDLVTIAFGLRNVSDRAAALREMYRVLAPGGRMICLEFSQALPLIAPAYDAYSRHVIPRLGALVAGRGDAYRYLVESIRAFPDQTTLKAWMETTGFGDVSYENLFFGIAALHVGTRPAQG